MYPTGLRRPLTPKQNDSDVEAPTDEPVKQFPAMIAAALRKIARGR
jgi:hypothetical protein